MFSRSVRYVDCKVGELVRLGYLVCCLEMSKATGRRFR